MQASGSPVLLEHLFRREAGRIVAWLAGLLGPAHLQLAEDAAQEAMLSALQTWPFQGVPNRPEAWLFRTAHNYAISAVRRIAVFNGKASDLIAALDVAAEPRYDLDAEQDLQDDELRMIFMCCHPKLALSSQLALSLKLTGGFSVEEIARVLFSNPNAIAQRLVRAKRLIREQCLTLAMPPKTHLERRLSSVLKVIYLMFSGGYAAHTGEDLIRVDVCLEALRLGRLIASSSLGDPRVDALVALMALQAARLPARADAGGDLILLEEQDRALWDDSLIALGFTYFDRSLAGSEVSEWHIQAAIAATYTSVAHSEEIDWAAILEHYDQLVEMTGSPVAALNRAVVVMKLHGAETALGVLHSLQENDVLQKYHLYHAVRGHMLTALSMWEEARMAFSAALACECSEPEKRFLSRQLEIIKMRKAHSETGMGLPTDFARAELR